MRVLIALLAGLVFGAGLTIAQMVNPAKVLAFLDFGAIPPGGWDPSLALVMGAALLVAAPAFMLARRRGRPFFEGNLRIPTRRDIDARLLAGAALFGGGWGLVGFCTGPAIAALAYGQGKPLIFVVAMIAGMAIHELNGPWRARLAAEPAT